VQQLGALILGATTLGVMMPYPTPDAPSVPTPERVSASVPSRGKQRLLAEPAPKLDPPDLAPEVPSVPSACPAQMVLVEGSYCTEVRHTCEHWLDDEKLPFARCGRYAGQARCVGKRIPKRFCIDRFESSEAAPNALSGTEVLPLNHQSFQLAGQHCAKLGKRLCTESEWTFACEGEDMLPYPYGVTREAVCNQDRPDLYENNPRRRILRDLRVPNDPDSRCVSPFGVVNMVGNLDEPVLRETGRQPKFNNALKGGWWMAGRNRCRPATTAHDDYYKDIQVGVRCCAESANGPKFLVGAPGF